MLMSPRNGETAIHGCHCLGYMAVHMCEVLARPWDGVCVPLALSLSYHKCRPLITNHLLSTKQMSLERCGGCLRYHLFGSHHCIKEIHALHKLLTCQWARGGGGGMPKKVIVGRFHPEDQTAYPFIYHFGQKRYPFPIHLIEKRYPFYIHSLELSIPFNCCKCT